jgi:Ca2+-binding EF-hand superfamily protein
MLSTVAVTSAAEGASSSVSRQQFELRQSKRFFRADSDGNGLVSKPEFESARAAAQAARAAKRFSRLDANKDGSVDEKELNAVLDRRFNRLDANKDDVLSPDERPGKKKSD